MMVVLQLSALLNTDQMNTEQLTVTSSNHEQPETVALTRNRPMVSPKCPVIRRCPCRRELPNARRTYCSDACRFWHSVRIPRCRRDRGSRCWPWKGGASAGGYGHFGGVHAHRYAMKLSGVEPAGMHVCHRCDNRLCCNPAHLFLGTPLDNALDCLAKGRHRGGRKRRPNFTPEVIATLYEMADADEVSRQEIADTLDMSIRNVYVLLAKRRRTDTTKGP